MLKFFWKYTAHLLRRIAKGMSPYTFLPAYFDNVEISLFWRDINSSHVESKAKETVQKLKLLDSPNTMPKPQASSLKPQVFRMSVSTKI